jgi:hypothetical protein
MVPAEHGAVTVIAVCCFSAVLLRARTLQLGPVSGGSAQLCVIKVLRLAQLGSPDSC